MNKPLIKNAISYGIPTIISAIGIIMALDKLKKYNYLFIFFYIIITVDFSLIAIILFQTRKVDSRRN